jgi:hypothetical protein
MILQETVGQTDRYTDKLYFQYTMYILGLLGLARHLILDICR